MVKAFNSTLGVYADKVSKKGFAVFISDTL